MDWFWRLGVWDRVVGITALCPLPAGAEWRPRVSGFSSANVGSILALKPDLIVTFSDVQAGIAAELVLRGCTVLATNQRTLAEVTETLELLARVVDRVPQGQDLLEEFRGRLRPRIPIGRRPRVYFEEWNAPLITGIPWVTELIHLAGGEDVFATAFSDASAASQRVITSAKVIASEPDIILASWCGKPVRIPSIMDRPGWQSVPAVRRKAIFEIPSAHILQPGFMLMDGFERLCEYLAKWNPEEP